MNSNQIVNSLISDILIPPSLPTKQTSQFKGIPHDEILYAYKYWIEYLKLLLPEPMSIEILQGRQDEGVDLVVKFLSSGKKIGLQVKSYAEIKQDTFQSTIMAQITRSKKHNLSKLLVIPCGDLENRSHSSKIRNLMSQIDQLQDGDYALVIQPQNSLPVFQCYKNKKHPMHYLHKNKKTTDLINGLQDVLSTDDLDAKIKVTFTNKKLPKKRKKEHNIEIKFAPFDPSSSDNPMDRFWRVSQLGETVRFADDEIKEIISKSPDGTIKKSSSSLELFSIKDSKGPYEIFAKGNESESIKNVILYREQTDGTTVIIKTGKEILPWEAEIISSESQLSIKLGLNLNMADFEHVAKTERIWRSALKTGILIFRDLKNNEDMEIIVSKTNLLLYEEEAFQNIQKIAFIQEKSKQRIDFSLDRTLYDMNTINMLCDFIKNRQVKMKSKSFDVKYDKKLVTKMVKDIEENDSISIHELQSSMVATIVGQRINLGKVKVSIPNTIIDSDLEDIKSKLVIMGDYDLLGFPIKSKTNSEVTYEFMNK